MGDWKISIVNQTGQSGMPGRDVEVMLFQTMPDPLTTDSYSSAWRAGDIQYPGILGPINLPVEVQFYVLDKVDGEPRQSGPFDVKFGQNIEVTQKNVVDAPNVGISGEPQPSGEIKVTNLSGNAKPLEMALYKDGKKIVSFKDVNPGQAVFLAVKPTIYIADINGKGIKQGTDFKAVVQAAHSTQFQLHPDLLEVKIGIQQKPNKELVFVQLQ